MGGFYNPRSPLLYTSIDLLVFFLSQMTGQQGSLKLACYDRPRTIFITFIFYIIFALDLNEESTGSSTGLLSVFF